MQKLLKLTNSILAWFKLRVISNEETTYVSHIIFPRVAKSEVKGLTPSYQHFPTTTFPEFLAPDSDYLA